VGLSICRALITRQQAMPRAGLEAAVGCGGHFSLWLPERAQMGSFCPKKEKSEPEWAVWEQGGEWDS